MAKVTIEFHGVCVHVRRVPTGAELPEGVDHRIVTIDGRQGSEVNGHHIAPHVPQVEVYRERPNAQTPPGARLLLDKHHLRIDGGPKGQPEVSDVDHFRRAIPPLRDFHKTISLDPGVIVDGNLTAGFFDLSGGTIRGEFRHLCAGVAVFEAEVEAHATLQTSSIGGNFVDLFSLSGDTWIMVSNVGDASDDHNADFLLNYLISGSIPDKASFPTDCRKGSPWVPNMTYPFHSIGPGCSNTQYP